MNLPSPRRRGRNARWLLAAALGVLVGGAAVTAAIARRHHCVLERIAHGA